MTGPRNSSRYCLALAPRAAASASFIELASGPLDTHLVVSLGIPAVSITGSAALLERQFLHCQRLLELELLAGLLRLELGLVACKLGVCLGNLMGQLRLQHRLFAHGVELLGLDLLLALHLGRLHLHF